MIETTSSSTERPFHGRMFLYQQPELLTKADHGNLGFSSVERPFDFVRTVRAVPLVSMEFSSAQKDYPIVFSDTEVPAPLAVLGVVDDVNLFVDGSGNWERRCYVPFYLRCHPIGFAKASNDQLAVVIDRAAAAVSDNPEEPFFDGDELAEKMQRRVDSCARYNLEREKTLALGKRLKELGLFTGQQVKHEAAGKEQPLGSYAAVNVDELGKLDAATLRELHADGSLSAIYAHVFSLENWSRLLDRRVQRNASKV